MKPYAQAPGRPNEAINNPQTHQEDPPNRLNGPARNQDNPPGRPDEPERHQGRHAHRVAWVSSSEVGQPFDGENELNHEKGTRKQGAVPKPNLVLASENKATDDATHRPP